MITFLFVGKNDKEYEVFIKEYTKRLQKFTKVKIIEIVNGKYINNSSNKEKIKKEAQLISKYLNINDYLIILDERGQFLNSNELSYFLEKKQHFNPNLVFLIGGAYGLDENIYNRANFKLSLSKMTFTHQMVRLIILEQVYRAFTIINNLPYHH